MRVVYQTDLVSSFHKLTLSNGITINEENVARYSSYLVIESKRSVQLGTECLIFFTLSFQIKKP